MITASKPARRLGLLLAVLLLCLVPAPARANSAHNPFWKDVVLSDTGEAESIRVYVDGPDESFYLFKTFESEHKKDQKIWFERPQDAKRFYIEVTMTDGAVRAWWAAHPGATLAEFRAACADPGAGLPPDALSRYRRLLDEGAL